MEMIMKWKVNIICAMALSVSLLTGCTYNPFLRDNHLTGNPVTAGVGAGIGAGAVALLGGPKVAMLAGGIAGGAIGYYATTLRYASGGVLQTGGKVYKIGDYLGIYIPTDDVFESNTADFLPQAKPILDSTVAILKRYPNRSILISGNTSGFYRARWEQNLSERRAQKVAAYLWNQGISHNNPRLRFDQLNYIGNGDYFPIAKPLSNRGIRQNSHIQMTSYPEGINLLGDKKCDARNMGEEIIAANGPPATNCETMDSEGKCLDLVGAG
jgi:hypothetical protein